jgi:hypothetical protein
MNSIEYMNNSYNESACITDLHDRFRTSSCFDRESQDWTPLDAWTCFNSREDKPHILLMMAHTFQVDDQLLRGEVLRILAAMIPRLENFHLCPTI